MQNVVATPELRRMAPLVILVVGLHAALLATPVRSARPHDGDIAGGRVQVRMIAAVPAAAGEATVVPTVKRPVSQPAVEPVKPAAESELVAPEKPAQSPAPDSPAAVTPPLPAFGVVVPGIDSDDDYYPRSMLTTAPGPLAVVMIDYPPIENDRGHYSSELTLFIDETGRVARVRVDGPELPQALEAAARNAFINAAFHAGELDGRAVKSQIRIEVVFDSRSGGTT